MDPCSPSGLGPAWGSTTRSSGPLDMTSGRQQLCSMQLCTVEDSANYGGRALWSFPFRPPVYLGATSLPTGRGGGEGSWVCPTILGDRGRDVLGLSHYPGGQGEGQSGRARDGRSRGHSWIGRGPGAHRDWEDRRWPCCTQWSILHYTLSKLTANSTSYCERR